jgi:ABC-2 type transport system ATP-binding protein
MTAAIALQGAVKRFGDFTALAGVDLTVERGEFFGLLGPNGAGKTTLISLLAGLARPSAGSVRVMGFDVVRDYRQARRAIGVVPQELVFDPFFTVREILRIQSGYFGLTRNEAWIEELLHGLGLADKAEANMRTLSGGMKRRVLVAQALVHRPPVIVLDEPTAGVDVALRRDMWALVRELQRTGVTIILTTHYIEEAEEMADRIGVIQRGRLLLVQDKHELMHQLGRKQLTLHLTSPLHELPSALQGHALTLSDNGAELVYTYDAQGDAGDVPALLAAVVAAGITFKDVQTTQSSLEDIFVSLLKEEA